MTLAEVAVKVIPHASESGMQAEEGAVRAFAEARLMAEAACSAGEGDGMGCLQSGERWVTATF